jgi:hypothetical protein
MSGILLAQQGCQAGQRDWRRCTVGTSGGVYGFSTGLGIGTISTVHRTFRGQTINVLDSGSSTNFRIVFGGLVAQNFFDTLEVLRADGTSLFLRQNLVDVYGQGGGSTEWDWIIPANSGWTSAENTKTVGFALS